MRPGVATAAGGTAYLGFDREIERVRAAVGAWLQDADVEVREALRWQFAGGSKYFRPLTIFTCYTGLYEGAVPPEVVRAAVVIELVHNVSLVVDDILDRSEQRRGRDTLHRRFGELPALMVSGYIVAQAYRELSDDPFGVRMVSELMSRLGIAECMQWRLRRQPLGVEDWRRIASEDTGSMFEVCACLGTRTEELRRFGHLLGVLYHGCDDVGDVRGGAALGGGGAEDLRDGILTLPAALAIQEPRIASIFVDPEPGEAGLRALAEAFLARLPEAERYLDSIADEARAEARSAAANVEPLIALVDQTRRLSSR